MRELLYQRVFDQAELRVGIGRVFWGVTESYKLVDVINQTDLVENVDREDKLGQPLVNLTFVRDWGALDLYVLPGFRERTYPGREGRLRSEPLVDTNRATYESGGAAIASTTRCDGRMPSGISTSASPTSGARAGSLG